MTIPPHLHRRRGASLLAAAFLAGVLTLTAGPAFADPSATPSAPPAAGGSADPAATGTITWAVQPSTADGPDQRPSFTYTNIDPGTVVNDYVGVTNFSKEPVTFEVYAADAFNTAAGGIDLLPLAQPSKDVGAWVAIPKKTLVINPGERVNEPFALTVPFNATPGDHVGGIIASVSTTSTEENQIVKVDRRLAVPIFLRVKGDITSSVAVESISTSYHGTWNAFGGGSTEVSYTIRNTGNARLDLTSDIAVKGLFGLRLGTARGPALQNLLPGGTYRVTERVSGVFPLGPLTAHIQVSPAPPAGLPPAGAPPQAATGEAGLWATPWALLFLLALLVGLGFGIRAWVLRGREQTKVTMAKAVAKARRETVEELTGGAATTTAESGG